MTLSTLFNDMVLIGILLLVGLAIRELVKPLQKLFIPASIISGTIALLVGPQVIGVVAIPDSFVGFPGVLINLIVPGLVFGVTMNKKTVSSYLDYSALAQGSYGLQMFVGVAIGALLAFVWPKLPEGWGILGVFSYHGGHGDAIAIGEIFNNLGVEGTIAIGMVLSTLGVILAISLGMIIINIGVRKGWTQFITKPTTQPNWYYGGPLPKEEQSSIGETKTTSFSINHLALQLAWLLLTVWIGKTLIGLLANIVPLAAQLPAVIQGVIGAVILWPILCVTKLDRFVDTKVIKHLCGFMLEIVVLCAIATLDLKFVSTFFVPLILYTILIVAINTVFIFAFGRKICTDQWFEKVMMVFGMSLGNTATGLALVRACDPNSQSNVPDANGVYAALFFWKYIFLALTPIWLQKGPWLTIFVGFIMTIGCIALGIIAKKISVAKNKSA